MKFAAKGDPLARALGMCKPDPVKPEVPKPVLPVIKTDGQGKHYDFDAVRDDLEAYVRQENHEKGRSITRIARDDFKLAPTHFSVTLKRLEITIVSHPMARNQATKKTDEKCEQAYEMYLAHRSYAKLAKHFGISDTSAKRWVLEGELMCRPKYKERGIYIAPIME